MVQRKVANKLGIQANTTLKTDNTKPSIQNHDGKSKGADLKAKRMKKSRSIKRSDVDFSLRSSLESHEVSQQPGKPPPLITVTPTNTPSPKKPSACNKSPYASPNYMKSTSSSEARKEKLKVSISSSSKLHRVEKMLSKTSSLKKVRSLTKAPSFKHTRTGSNKKAVLCDNLDVKRATCSSTLKDYKFPPYLTLTPGATEAEGTSVAKVCTYTYCSLNGHHHNPAPPLKRFLSSRRRLLKTQKAVKPQAISPRKRKPSETDVKEDDSEVAVVFSDISAMPENQNEDFFVEIYAPGRENVAANDDMTMEHESIQVSESEIDAQDDLDQNKDADVLDTKFNPEDTEDEDYPQTTSEGSDIGSDLEMDSFSSVSLDQLFDETSVMEWEEGQIPATHDEGAEIPDQSDCGYDQDEPGLKLEEFLADKLLPYIHDEIMEYLQFSDDDSVPDSKSTQTDEEHIEEPVIIKEEDSLNIGLENETAEKDSAVVDEAICEHGAGFSNPAVEITEREGEESNEDNDTDGETTDDNDGCNVMEEIKSRETTPEDIPPMTEDVENVCSKEEIATTGYDSQADDQSEGRNEADASLSMFSECLQPDEESFLEKDVTNSRAKAEQKAKTNSKEQNDSSRVKLLPNQNCAVEEKTPEMEDIHRATKVDVAVSNRNDSPKTSKSTSHTITDSTEELLESCNKLTRSIRCKKADEDSEEAREFNPRGPNFLPVEPDPEAEKVDLRHQDMDERKNTEEWMLDFALRKTVNQLAPARKRKVALLVEAFEAVLPVPKYEHHTRRNSSGFAHARSIEACS